MHAGLPICEGSVQSTVMLGDVEFWPEVSFMPDMPEEVWL